MKAPLLSGLIALALVIAGCFEGSTGGSETTNGLAGVIKDVEGAPVARARVTLVPEAYNPVPGKDETVLRTTLTDGAGRYAFAGVAPGTYNVEGRDTVRRLMLLIPGVRVEEARDKPVTADGILEAPGSILVPFADRVLPAGAVAYIPGTTWYTGAIPGSTLTLAALPPGRVPMVKLGFIDSAADLAYTLIEGVDVRPGAATAMTPVDAWRHSRSLDFDGRLLASGETLAGYPLLLRLRAPAFDFAQARPAGEDIRFARPDGTTLPYQIEHWDPVAGTAAVWIRLDSLPPGKVAVASMHWGREDAVDQGSGPAVFDTALEFSSVWHLAETENVDAGGYRDAASFAHATAVAPNPPSRIEAVAGFGKRFADGGGSLTAPMPLGLGGNRGFTVSFWVRFQADARRQQILRFGGDTLLVGFHFLIRPDTTAQFGPFDRTPDAEPSAWQNHFSLRPYVGRWIQVATTYDPAAAKLTTYINGEVAAVNDLPLLDIQAAGGVKVGGTVRDIAAEASLQGGLDEVRFYDRPLGQARIRADYETQKEGSALLEMK